jgi:hypothetical protein
VTVTQLTELLTAECEAAGNTDFTSELLAAAKTAILAGAGSIAPLTSGSLNGKSFTRDIKLSHAEVALACRRALSLYNEDAGESPITFLDFSRALPSYSPGSLQ